MKDVVKKLFIETYGCQMNVADSEVVGSILRVAGYEACEDIKEADLILLSTCSIRDNAEQKIDGRRLWASLAAWPSASRRS